MSERKLGLENLHIQELDGANTRDIKKFPFETKWDIPSAEAQVTAHIEQFDKIVDNLPDSWLTEDDVFALKLCFNEILVNAWKHGNKRDPRKYIHVEIQMTNDEFEVSILDESLVEFNPNEVPDPTAPENLYKPSGRGVLFTNNFFGIGKDAKFEFLNPGNKITLTRHRNTEKA